MLQLEQTLFQAWPERYLYGKGWDVFGLYAFGRKIVENCAVCPLTTKAVEAIPGLTTAGFSRMRAGTHIKPHTGYTSAVLRCHLGLVIPDNCALRVGETTTGWQPGKTMVFDDTTEHEAWNRSDKDRIVLLLDFKRPGAVFETPQWIKQLIPQ